MWHCLVYLGLAPAYLAFASGIFLAISFMASLTLLSQSNQMAVALIGTGIVLTGSVKLFEVLDE